MLVVLATWYTGKTVQPHHPGHLPDSSLGFCPGVWVRSPPLRARQPGTWLATTMWSHWAGHCGTRVLTWGECVRVETRPYWLTVSLENYTRPVSPTETRQPGLRVTSHTDLIPTLGTGHLVIIFLMFIQSPNSHIWSFLTGNNGTPPYTAKTYITGSLSLLQTGSRLRDGNVLLQRVIRVVEGEMFGCSPLPRPACVCPAGGDDPRLPVSRGGREKLVLADTAAQPSYLLPALVRQGLRYQLTTDNDIININIISH